MTLYNCDKIGVQYKNQINSVYSKYMMTIKNDFKEILKLADNSIRDNFMSLSYPIGTAIIGILLYYFNEGFHGWLGGVSITLLFFAVGNFMERDAYRKGFTAGYDVVIEDASPDSSEYKKWLSEV